MRDTLEGVITDPKKTASERVGDLIFQFRAGEFFQNNPFILPRMVEHVVAEASEGGFFTACGRLLRGRAFQFIRGRSI